MGTFIKLCNPVFLAGHRHKSSFNYCSYAEKSPKESREESYRRNHLSQTTVHRVIRSVSETQEGDSTNTQHPLRETRES